MTARICPLLDGTGAIVGAMTFCCCCCCCGGNKEGSKESIACVSVILIGYNSFLRFVPFETVLSTRKHD